MRYELKRNTKGMITQCETNADGGNIYARREEINKQALENLARQTPGKLGNLSNLQIFNFELSAFSTGTQAFVLENYNTTNTFPANATRTIMFGVDGINNKALYYNIVGINCKLGGSFFQGGVGTGTQNPSFVSFYLLQNIETSTTSLGTKIPQPAPLSGNGGGSLDITTTGNDFGNQSISIDLNAEQGFYAQNNQTKGLRASGLAMRQIYLNFGGAIDTSLITIDVEVLVDTSSVSTTY
tara:strand:+ start:503 stop:1222 length:720 start_codon:yes stop_codon:yes gene_type:complete